MSKASSDSPQGGAGDETAPPHSRAEDLERWEVPDEPSVPVHGLGIADYEIAHLSINDVLEVIALGVADFRRAAIFGIAFGAIYGVGGWVLLLMLYILDLPYLVYPLAAGFALIAPFIACTFYRISHDLERAQPVTWRGIFASLRLATQRDLGWMSLITGFSMFIWLDIAAVLFFGFFGLKSMSIYDLLREIFTTGTGWVFLLVGNAAGAVLAMLVFSISVTSFPMLYHRDIDFITAMVTSVRVVRRNPKPMVFWAATIAVITGLSLLSGFAGLFLTLPILGHASWHLYRRAVLPRPARPN